jgi:cytochrome c551/c552
LQRFRGASRIGPEYPPGIPAGGGVVRFTKGKIMRKFAFPISTLSFMTMTVVSVANADTQNLAIAKQCFDCHAAVKQVGKAPAFKALADKYKGTANVEANLAQKIRDGGEGHWGSIPMPGAEGVRPDVSEVEAKELAAWILAQH